LADGLKERALYSMAREGYYRARWCAIDNRGLQ